MEKIYNKLIRDKIPEIIRNDNETPVIRKLSDSEFKTELEKKLLEEYNEVLLAKNKDEYLEELADMLEVISSLSELENSNLQSVIKIMREKRQKRGGFYHKIFLEKVVTKNLF